MTTKTGMDAFGPPPQISPDGTLTMRGPFGPGEALNLLAASVQRFTEYVRSFGKRERDGRFTAPPEAIEELWHEVCIFAGLPSGLFYPALTPEQQAEFERSGAILRALPVGRGGIPHDVNEACSEVLFKLVDPEDRRAVPVTAIDRLEGLTEYVRGLAARYGPTPVPDAAAELADLATAIEDEQFDHAGLRLMMVVKPLGTPEDWAGHGLRWAPDPSVGLDDAGPPKGRLLKVWIAGPPEDLGKPVASGDVVPVSRWLRHSGAGIQVRVFVFGEVDQRVPFLELARRAGSLLPYLPESCSRKLSAERIDSFALSIDPAVRWMLGLFPLAWRTAGKSGLTAWRGAVDERGAPITLPLDSSRLRGPIGVQKTNSPSMKAYFERLPVPPDDYVTVLGSDLFEASAAACHILQGFTAHAPVAAAGPSGDISARGQERPDAPLVLVRPVRISDVAEQVNQRADKFQDKLKRAGARIAGKNVEFQDLWLVVPEHKKALTHWADKQYPSA